jgi:hypothetical protein
MLRLTTTILMVWPLAFGVQSSGDQPAPAAPPRQDCTAPEHRQFDFWIGEWDVVAQGTTAGRNRISADLKGCVIVENWTAKGGGRGSSLNFYDRITRVWYQSWIDEQGGALLLKGGLRDGRMVLQSEPVPNPKGDSTVQRITWTPEENGLRQLWESSADGGKTWKSVFDGKYVKAR